MKRFAVTTLGLFLTVQAPHAADSIEVEPEVVAPAECPGILSYDNLYYIGQNGHFIINGRKFIGDDQEKISKMLASWYLPHISYAFITGGSKQDNVHGFKIKCDYNYRTVTQKAYQTTTGKHEWTSFSIVYDEEQGKAQPTPLSKAQYLQALQYLGLNEDTPNAQVRRMAIGGDYHPDKGGDPDVFLKRNAAYDIIKLYRQQQEK